jgi:alpha-L-fucosidase
MILRLLPLLLSLILLISSTCPAEESAARRDARMEWWREARFGLFIHWGLYAIPAGEWNGKRNYAEWIRHRAKIPVDEYGQLVDQFNPVEFDARQWVRLAKRAGMKYLVITSKHHDGFCLWDSAQTDFDIASTPFGRDPLGELAAACREEGVRLCFYHSIMDWHHPDYLPRRKWEVADRPADGADFDRFRLYLKGQLKELVERYDPGVLWFDGEWEDTWTHDMGMDLDDYVRGLNPDIIINNRVDKGRQGMKGLTREGDFRGDFGTPEQEVPEEGLPGVDWESCMTMNRHWGWNRFDDDWKSTLQLVRTLIDTASKGGNFLLNVGPTPEGTFPDRAVTRLEGMGDWMRTNSESIYGTQASPIGRPAWGRCTRKTLADGKTLLFLHVFDWPAGGQLELPGLGAKPGPARLLAGGEPLAVDRTDDRIVIQLPERAPDPIATVVRLELSGEMTSQK